MRGPKIFIVAASSLAVLLLMAWTVGLRMGESGRGPMLARNTNMRGRFGTVRDLSQLAAGETVIDRSGLPVLSDGMPEFEGIAQWLNSVPLTEAGLRGKVVLIDFWTYSCINCIRTLPYVTSWDAKYRDKGLVVIGVHTPEFAFEKEERNVRAAIQRHGIAYPVAMDNAFRTWNAYDNRYWPAKYLFDADGRLRYRHFGEGEYDVTERNIQRLLEEAGVDADLDVTEMPSSVDFTKIGSPETYLGHSRIEGFASPEGILRDRPRIYSVPPTPLLNRLYLGGDWTIGKERALLNAAPGEIVFRYRASAANLVMGTVADEVLAEVSLDGAPVPAGDRGADLFEEGGRTYVRVRDERLYNLIDAGGKYGERLLRVRFLDAGVEAYAFTFG